MLDIYHLPTLQPGPRCFLPDRLLLQTTLTPPLYVLSLMGTCWPITTALSLQPRLLLSLGFHEVVIKWKLGPVGILGKI